jgi:hypothetical protein
MELKKEEQDAREEEIIRNSELKIKLSGCGLIW